MFTQKQIIAGITGLVLVIIAILIFFLVIQKGESKKETDAQTNKPVFSVGENAVPKKWADEYREKVLKVPTDCKDKEEECKGARELADKTLLNVLGGAVRDHQVAQEQNIKYKGDKYKFYIDNIQLSGTEKQLSPELQQYLKESRFIASQVLGKINKKAKKTFLTKKELDKLFKGKEDFYNAPERRQFSFLVFPSKDQAEKARAGLISNESNIEGVFKSMNKDYLQVSSPENQGLSETGFTINEVPKFAKHAFKSKVGVIPPVLKHKMSNSDINFFFQEGDIGSVKKLFSKPQYFVFVVYGIQKEVKRSPKETKALMAQNVENDRREKFIQKEVQKVIKKSTEKVKCDDEISVKCEIPAFY